MPSLTKLSRIVRLATLPESRGLIIAAARSPTVREIARRARHDRAALARDLRNPANLRELIRSAVRHPAAQELASAGLLFLPWRYLPVGWAGSWAAHKVLRRYVDPPVDVLDPSAFGSSGPLPNVTPDVAKA
jgi:hypothetical protein